MVDLVEPRHEVRKVYPVVAVQVKRGDRFVCRDLRHRVGVQDTIDKVQPAIAVEVFKEKIAVRPGRGMRHRDQGGKREMAPSASDEKPVPAIVSILPAFHPLLRESHCHHPFLESAAPFQSGDRLRHRTSGR